MFLSVLSDNGSITSLFVFKVPLLWNEPVTAALKLESEDSRDRDLAKVYNICDLVLHKTSVLIKVNYQLPEKSIGQVLQPRKVTIFAYMTEFNHSTIHSQAGQKVHCTSYRDANPGLCSKE